MSRRPAYPIGVWVLLGDQALMNAGFFMLYPLLAVHLTSRLGFDATTAGLILAARILVQQGLAPLGGALSDRIGYKPAIVAGFAVRSVGFAAFGVVDTLAGVLVAATIMALGGTLFDPPSRAGLARLTPEHERANVYAASGVAAWSGQAVGPLIGTALLPVGFQWVSWTAAFLFLLGSLQAALFLPGGMRGHVGASVTVFQSVAATMRDRSFAAFTALMVGYYFLVLQLVVTVPILANRRIGPEAIGPIFAIQAVLALVLQVPLTRWATGRFGSFAQLAGSMSLIAGGFAVYSVAGTFWPMAVATAIVAVGQLLVWPVQSTLTARLAGGRAGAYFGVGALALGVGGALGTAGGGFLLDTGDRLGVPWLPWLVMSAIALGTGLGFWRLGQDPRLQARLVALAPPAPARAAPPQPARIVSR